MKEPICPQAAVVFPAFTALSAASSFRLQAGLQPHSEHEALDTAGLLDTRDKILAALTEPEE